MVQSCSAYNCTERYKPGSGVSFHVFPDDPEIKKKWLVNMRRKNFTPTKYTRLCSKHFAPSCYFKNGWSSKKALKLDAVPTIFSFPDQPENESHIEDSPESSSCQDDIDMLLENKPDTNHIFLPRHEESTPETSSDTGGKSSKRKKRQTYLGDFKETQLVNEKYKFTVKRILTKKQQQIKMLQQRNRRLEQKVAKLTSILNYILEQESD
ncbi:THAP domain-containing protein 1-like [Sitophilus oryzae]|uniref:THAP domain-containing protein 1-like n=1 Tax=Sitophilus oryzae TaxID=7048 RepID=A0A6J2XU75_SITOR|nr:THAP domain-containing protein 1-like [Sitophilus oryzae]